MRTSELYSYSPEFDVELLPGRKDIEVRSLRQVKWRYLFLMFVIPGRESDRVGLVDPPVAMLTRCTKLQLAVFRAII